MFGMVSVFAAFEADIIKDGSMQGWRGRAARASDWAPNAPLTQGSEGARVAGWRNRDREDGTAGWCWGQCGSSIKATLPPGAVEDRGEVRL